MTRIGATITALVFLQGCMMSLPELKADRATQITALKDAYKNEVQLARYRCVAIYARAASSDVAEVRKKRTNATNAITVVSAIIAAATGFISALQPPNTTATPPTVAQATAFAAGATASLATLAPVFNFIASGLEPSFSDLNSSEQAMMSYVYAVKETPDAGVTPPTSSMDTAVQKMTNAYGGNFGNDLIDPCINSLSGTPVFLPQ